MKIILIALLCGITLQVLEATPIKCMQEPCEVDIYGPDFKCQPHTSFTHPDGCNTCFCKDDGKAGGCTRMLCPKPASNKFCKAGEIVEIAGLKCECKELPHGVSWACEGHIKREIKTYSVDVFDPEFKCKPDEQVMLPDGVNFCLCSPEGKISACTYSAIKTPKCQSGQTFKQDCNTCFCGDNGMAACTLMECSVPPMNIQPASLMTKKPKDVCTPGEVVEIAGLKCECKEIPHGIFWTCEGHFEKQVQTYSANKCTPGTTFKIDCNRCFCNDNGMAACTKMGCLHTKTFSNTEMRTLDPLAKDFSCIPHESFKHVDGCNTCVCMDNGKLAACTLELCPSQRASSEKSVMDPSDPNFHCSPGQHLSLGATDSCICGKDGKHVMCTYSANSNDEFHCTPGEHFHIGPGNTCICEADGKHAECTISAVDYVDTDDDPVHKCSTGDILRGKCNL